MYKQICPKTVPSEFKVSGVYCISLGEHFYIGSSKNVQQRISQHRKKLRAHKHQSKFQTYYDKYGENVMYISLLEKCDEFLIKAREKYWIETLEPDINYEGIINTNITAVILNGSGSKKVYQYSMEGAYIGEFPSVKEAGRTLKVDSRGIGLCAKDSYVHYKSAYGYRWSYKKVDKLPEYQNNSSKAVNRTVIIFDVLTGEEYLFESVAEAVRTLEPEAKNFDSSCASLCSVANKTGYYLGHYIAKNDINSPYILPKRNSFIYDVNHKRIYKDLKEASKILNLSTYKLSVACKKQIDLLYINYCASVKLRESGKLFIEDNPNPSSTEM